MCLTGKLVRVSTTLADGCPQPLASCALKSGDSLSTTVTLVVDSSCLSSSCMFSLVQCHSPVIVK